MEKYPRKSSCALCARLLSIKHRGEEEEDDESQIRRSRFFFFSVFGLGKGEGLERLVLQVQTTKGISPPSRAGKQKSRQEGNVIQKKETLGVIDKIH